MLYESTGLLLENKKRIHYNGDYLEKDRERLSKFISNMDFMKSIDFANRIMFSTEIKSNNTIEGIYDDISYIEKVISKRYNKKEDVKRILNLYKGYKYILTHESINKDSLKELYSILSNGLLTKEELNSMGKYYRNDMVYIFSTNDFEHPYLGIEPEKLDYYMDMFFDYVNNSELDPFLKSQIMHFYFVYIHPFFDVNGRCSRTLSMWYLLNKKEYPYLIFNRAISFKRSKYIDNIITTRKHGDITLFLKFLLEIVLKELEKEYILYNINNNLNFNLSKEELQMLLYILSMNGNITIKDLITMYNNYNNHQKLNIIYYEKIKQLIDKEIIVLTKETNSYLIDGMKNYFIAINPKLLSINEELLSIYDVSKIKKTR